MTTKQIQSRLAYLKQEIEAEHISYQEIAELQSLAPHIPDNDILLLEWVGVPEFTEQCPTCGKIVDIDDIYTTHEDNEDPQNKTYCIKCQDTIN